MRTNPTAFAEARSFGRSAQHRGGITRSRSRRNRRRGGTFTPLPIAIPDFASSDPAFGREIADIVRANLKRSGLFAPLDPATLPQATGDVNNTPDFAAWRAVNVDALVMGQVDRGGQISSSMRVWDTQAAQQVTGNQYNADPQSSRRIAHIVSDAIYASLAGDNGYFDSQVLFVTESGPKANRRSSWRSWTRTAPICRC